MQTFGVYLVNNILPDGYKIKSGEVLTKSVMVSLLIRIAREKPDLYPKVTYELKKLGDFLSTTESYSPGLEDLDTPAEVEQLLHEVDLKVRAAPTFEKKVALLEEGQAKAVELAKKAKGAFAEHVRSGSRGNTAQLMRMIVSPVAVQGSKRGVAPLTIKRSFSQGLTPGEYFASVLEARQNAIDTQIQIQKPGAISKTFTSNLNNLIITEHDCGTVNGISVTISDHHILDRFTSSNTKHYRRNTLVDSLLIKKLTASNVNEVKVRSPLTCESRDGVCAKCYGLMENRQQGQVGTNIGVRSAQALSEPLAQWSLDRKHAARLSSGMGLRGFEAVEQLTKVPKNFLSKAAVSKLDGKINAIYEAPQGGTFIEVNQVKHYIEPGFKPLVEVNQDVESGTILSEGIPSPREIVELKGLGQGRQYYIDTLHKVYQNSGLDVDKRHLENLAKQTLNYVRVNKSDFDLNLFEGEEIPYNYFKKELQKKTKLVKINEALGKRLGKDYFHYTVGTIVSNSLLNDLKNHGVREVEITTSTVDVTPIMRSIEMVPLMNPDLLAKMGFRYLKKSFLEGVHSGAKSDVHGTSPWPSYMMGREFGEGPKGHY